jgi:outer membrane protein assembly factor BamE (lipoprotein component of BamABCDE complex)
MMRLKSAAALALVAVAAVAAASEDKASAGPTSAFTLGAVQKQLRVGLSQADVAERLGSPNILAREADGREAWVYDRVASEVEVSSSGVSLGGVGSGATGSVAGLVGVRAGKSRQKLQTAQRTLTVVIRFSASGTVESFTWHGSRF